MHSNAKLRIGSVLLGLGVTAAFPLAASASLFSGTWSVSGTIGNPVIGTIAPVCKWVTAGNRLSGTCKGPNGIGPSSGTFAGRAISFTWRHVATTSMGLTGVAVFKGVLGGDGVIRGTWRNPAAPSLTGQFTAMHP